MKNSSINTYVINLKSRLDRRLHILREFRDKNEFSVQIVDAIKNENGTLGLWLTIKHILQNLIDNKSDYILICEDDHQFTEYYSKNNLFAQIEEARIKNVDLLIGGASATKSLFQVSKSLVWIEGYTGNQFVIIFKHFFQVIIDAKFRENDVADHKLSSLASTIFLIYPFISLQKEFGYSDVTPSNAETGTVTDLFAKSSLAVQYILNSEAFYGFKSVTTNRETSNFSEFTIPTYVINLPERVDRLRHIKEQFSGRSEFDVTYINACKHEIGAVGLWNSIRKVIQMGIDNEDDVLIICEDDHFFTNHYSKEMFFKNILEAHEQGIDVLSGGTSGGFEYCLPVTDERFWVNHFLATQFIIVYSKFFQKIIDSTYDEQVTADNFLSQLTSNKMVFYPFISEQKNFGYSDVTYIHEEIEDLVVKMFDTASNRLSNIQKAYNQYKLHLS